MMFANVGLPGLFLTLPGGPLPAGLWALFTGAATAMGAN